MTFDKRRSAREKTPWGDFQIRPTHLKTGVAQFWEPSPIPPEEAHAAALVVADRVPAGEVREILDMLGLLAP